MTCMAEDGRRRVSYSCKKDALVGIHYKNIYFLLNSI